ncbi:hypothetical protein ACU686_31115 [Yinghuangia aomiensis]
MTSIICAKSIAATVLGDAVRAADGAEAMTHASGPAQPAICAAGKWVRRAAFPADDAAGRIRPPPAAPPGRPPSSRPSTASASKKSARQALVAPPTAGSPRAQPGGGAARCLARRPTC